MAGIGFELRRLMERDSIFAAVRAYAYAGIISSGPWIMSILGILMIGVLSGFGRGTAHYVEQFQVSVSYLIASSLILTGCAQLAFTRFAADRIFERREHLIRANFNGVMLLVTVLAGGLGSYVMLCGFAGATLAYRVLMVLGLTVASNIWMATIFLSAIKAYRAILFIFTGGYGVSVLLALELMRWRLPGMLCGFEIGQFLLLSGMLWLIYQRYPAQRLLDFAFLRRGNFYLSLAFVGIFYNLGVWEDKLIFWMNANTGVNVIGPLRASPIYDMPVFLSYLSIVPGMAVLLIKLEVDFVEAYEIFYQAVRNGGALEIIEDARNDMVRAVRQGVFQIIAIQALTALAVFVAGAALLSWLGISVLFLPLLFVNLVTASLQVLFLGVLNVLFYLDKRGIVLVLTALLVLLNGVLTLWTLSLGPKFYGYGFAGALCLVIMLGLWWLDRKLAYLEYDTFVTP